MRKALFIYNPMSGQRIVPDRIDYIIEKFMKNNILIQPFRLDKDDQQLHESILTDKYEYVVVSGGDGTISSVVNSLLKNKVKLPLGIIPSGTCNDLARSLNIQEDLDGALNTILKGKTSLIDTGLINDSELFLNTCAGGVFADVSYSTSGELKKNIGPLAYYMKAFSEVATMKSFDIRIKTEEHEINKRVILFLILNGRHAGGFSNIAPKASLDDGMFDIIIINSCPHIELAALFFRVLNGGLPDDRNVSIIKCKSCYIESDMPIFLSVDGEKSKGLPIKIDCIEKSLEVFSN